MPLVGYRLHLGPFRYNLLLCNGAHMHYLNGERVLLGDKVDLGGDMTGIVVAVIEDGLFAEGISPDEWSYLLVGALVESPEAGLMHYINADHDFVLVERAHSP